MKKLIVCLFLGSLFAVAENFEVKELTKEEVITLSQLSADVNDLLPRLAEIQKQLARAKAKHDSYVERLKSKYGEIEFSCTDRQVASFVVVTIKGRYALVEKGNKTCLPFGDLTIGSGAVTLEYK